MPTPFTMTTRLREMKSTTPTALGNDPCCRITGITAEMPAATEDLAALMRDSMLPEGLTPGEQRALGFHPDAPAE